MRAPVTVEALEIETRRRQSVVGTSPLAPKGPMGQYVSQKQWTFPPATLGAHCFRGPWQPARGQDTGMHFGTTPDALPHPSHTLVGNPQPTIHHPLTCPTCLALFSPPRPAPSSPHRVVDLAQVVERLAQQLHGGGGVAPPVVAAAAAMTCTAAAPAPAPGPDALGAAPHSGGRSQSPRHSAVAVRGAAAAAAAAAAAVPLARRGPSVGQQLREHPQHAQDRPSYRRRRERGKQYTVVGLGAKRMLGRVGVAGGEVAGASTNPQPIAQPHCHVCQHRRAPCAIACGGMCSTIRAAPLGCAASAAVAVGRVGLRPLRLTARQHTCRPHIAP